MRRKPIEGRDTKGEWKGCKIILRPRSAKALMCVIQTGKYLCEGYLFGGMKSIHYYIIISYVTNMIIYMCEVLNEVKKEASNNKINPKMNYIQIVKVYINKGSVRALLIIIYRFTIIIYTSLC